MNKFFSFFVRQWQASQPFGWIGVIIGYFTLVTTLFHGWVRVILILVNPMVLRICYRLYAPRSELNDIIDQTAIGIRARRELRQEQHDKRKK